MNYYKHWIGDFQRDTRHLSLAEQGAYRAMLDHYYATEKPLPRDPASLCRLVGCQSKVERQAVGRIAKEFFREEDGGLVNRRAKEEIEEAAKHITASRTNGRLGGRPRDNPTGNQEKTQQVTKTEPEAKGRQAPVSSSQSVKEILEGVSGSLRARKPRVDWSDPGNRKARWEQKIMEEVNRSMPDSDAQALIAAYIAGEPWAKAQFNAISDQLKAAVQARSA